MQCCAVVRATCRKQQTPQLWMEGRGRSVDSFVPWNHPTTILSPIAEKVSLSLKKGVPSVKATDIKITWLTFFQDQILCPLNGVIPWIEVPKRRYSTIILFIIFFKFRSSLRKKKLLLWRHLVIQVWYTVTVCNTTEGTASIPENTVIWLVHTSNYYLLLPWLLQTKLELCFLTCLITCSNK